MKLPWLGAKTLGGKNAKTRSALRTAPKSALWLVH
jgi:hypothetical protein